MEKIKTVYNTVYSKRWQHAKRMNKTLHFKIFITIALSGIFNSNAHILIGNSSCNEIGEASIYGCSWGGINWSKIHDLSNVFLNDENTTDNNPSDIAIIMSNINVLTESQPNGVNYVYFDFQCIELKTGAINNISDYTILENASFTNSEINNGNTILDDTLSGFTATNTAVNINSLNSSPIAFDFSFTREDGEIITGNYSGNYTDISQ
jgi:hypothetical protein